MSAWGQRSNTSLIANSASVSFFCYRSLYLWATDWISELLDRVKILQLLKIVPILALIEEKGSPPYFPTCYKHPSLAEWFPLGSSSYNRKILVWWLSKGLNSFIHISIKHIGTCCYKDICPCFLSVRGVNRLSSIPHRLQYRNPSLFLFHAIEPLTNLIHGFWQEGFAHQIWVDSHDKVLPSTKFKMLILSTGVPWLMTTLFGFHPAKRILLKGAMDVWSRRTWMLMISARPAQTLFSRYVAQIGNH